MSVVAHADMRHNHRLEGPRRYILIDNTVPFINPTSRSVFWFACTNCSTRSVAARMSCRRMADVMAPTCSTIAVVMVVMVVSLLEKVANDSAAFSARVPFAASLSLSTA